jgi:dolichol kinase
VRFGPAQSRAGSLAEAVTNVLVGYVVALVVQRAAYPLFGITTTLATESVIAVVFTVTSLIRSYLLRRLFEALSQHHWLGAGDART